MDIYSRVMPSLWEAAAPRFEEGLTIGKASRDKMGKIIAKNGGAEGIRTPDPLLAKQM